MTAQIQLISKTPAAIPADWRNGRTLAWAGYDIASSAYFGVAPAVLLPMYFEPLMAPLPNPTAAWGALAAGAILVSGLAALGAAVLAARIDRFPLLGAFTLGLILAMALLAWNPGSSLALAIAAYVAAQSCYFAATTIYESYLPDLLPPGLRQRLSGFGWAMGYLGGLLAIGILLFRVAGEAESSRLIAACFELLAVISAVLFAGALALMAKTGFTGLGRSAAAPRLLEMGHVLRQWRSYRPVFLLLAGTMAVQGGISVVVVITAPLLSARFGQSLPDLLGLLALIHILSVPSTLIWNSLLSRGSSVGPMCLLLVAWGAALAMLAYGSGSWMPVCIVSVIGCCLGATHSALRGFLAEAVPEGGGTAFFALSTAASRAAAAIGPAVFALLTALAKEQAALMVILAMMSVGSALVILHLRKVRRIDPI
jgi:UMF1 family MFS transporter